MFHNPGGELLLGATRIPYDQWSSQVITMASDNGIRKSRWSTGLSQRILEFISEDTFMSQEQLQPHWFFRDFIISWCNNLFFKSIFRGDFIFFYKSVEWFRARKILVYPPGNRSPLPRLLRRWVSPFHWWETDYVRLTGWHMFFKNPAINLMNMSQNSLRIIPAYNSRCWFRCTRSVATKRRTPQAKQPTHPWPPYL